MSEINGEVLDISQSPNPPNSVLDTSKGEHFNPSKNVQLYGEDDWCIRQQSHHQAYEVLL